MIGRRLEVWYQYVVGIDQSMLSRVGQESSYVKCIESSFQGVECAVHDSRWTSLILHTHMDQEALQAECDNYIQV